MVTCRPNSTGLNYTASQTALQSVHCEKIDTPLPFRCFQVLSLHKSEGEGRNVMRLRNTEKRAASRPRRRTGTTATADCRRPHP